MEMDGSNLACDIYFAKKQGNGFGASMALGLVNRDENDSSRGAPGAVSRRQFLDLRLPPWGAGGKDLWYVKAEDGSFAGAVPQNLGASINTEGDEMFPAFRDNGDLYWSTNGRDGLGSLDLWKAEVREGELAFAEPKVLPFPPQFVG